MIKTLLIDDEPLARGLVREYLQGYGQIQIVQECGDGFEGVKAINQYQPDLIFLDIQMPKISGFEMLELIENPPAVIFTTAFDEFALKAFEAHAIDYLLKPFSQERFDKALQKWLAQGSVSGAPSKQFLEEASAQQDELNRIVVKAGSAIKIIPIQEVFYFEAYDDYVKIHTKEGFFLKKKTMSEYEKGLNEQQFVRVHRSYMISVGQLTKIEPLEKDSYVALLKSGAKVPLSRSGYVKLKEVLGL